MHVLAHHELKRADERSFQRGYIDFAVTLSGVAVTYFKKGASGMNRNVKSRAGNQLFIIEVACMHPGRTAVYAARDLGRGHAHASEKRMQGNLDTFGEARNHLLFIERDYLHPRIREVFRQEPAARPERIVGVGYCKFDRLYSDLEHVARLRGFDEDRSGQDVTARPFVGDLPGYVAQRLLHLIGWESRSFEPRWARCDQRLYFDSVSGFDPKYGRRAGVVVAPCHGLRRCFQNYWSPLLRAYCGATR